MYIDENIAFLKFLDEQTSNLNKALVYLIELKKVDQFFKLAVFSYEDTAKPVFSYTFEQDNKGLAESSLLAVYEKIKINASTFIFIDEKDCSRIILTSNARNINIDQENLTISFLKGNKIEMCTINKPNIN